MTRTKLLGVVVGAYALGLIATAPATLLDASLKHATDGRVRLAQAHGTLWSGTGQIEIVDVSQHSGVAKGVAWRVRPASLLRGKVVCEVVVDQATRNPLLTITFSGIEIADAEFSVPATVLGVGVPKLAPLRLGGELQLNIGRLSMTRGGMAGGVTLHWRVASSGLTTVAPLGDYELRFDDDGARGNAVLRTLRGPLQLEGKGAWAQDDIPAFPVSARIAPQYRSQLEPLLRLIARERGDGSFELQLR
jgi:general secretion pathway protein N